MRVCTEGVAKSQKSFDLDVGGAGVFPLRDGASRYASTQFSKLGLRKSPRFSQAPNSVAHSFHMGESIEDMQSSILYKRV